MARGSPRKGAPSHGSPILRLPHSVIEHIFVLVAGGSAQALVVTLPLVCRRWLQLVASSNLLWRHIKLRIDAGTFPDYDMSREDEQRLADWCGARLGGRVRELELADALGEGAAAIVLGALRGAPGRQLRTLRLHTYCGGQRADDSDEADGGGATWPPVVAASERALDALRAAAPGWQHLTRLELVCAAGPGLDAALCALPSLRVLCVLRCHEAAALGGAATADYADAAAGACWGPAWGEEEEEAAGVQGSWPSAPPPPVALPALPRSLRSLEWADVAAARDGTASERALLCLEPGSLAALSALPRLAHLRLRLHSAPAGLGAALGTLSALSSLHLELRRGGTGVLPRLPRLAALSLSLGGGPCALDAALAGCGSLAAVAPALTRLELRCSGLAELPAALAPLAALAVLRLAGAEPALRALPPGPYLASLRTLDVALRPFLGATQGSREAARDLAERLRGELPPSVAVSVSGELE